MDNETVEQDKERLDHLQEEIDSARHHLDVEKAEQEEPRFYDEGGEGEGPVPG